MTLPNHIQRELIAAGDLTTNRVTTKPRPRRCPTCSAWCVAAIPELWYGSQWVELKPTTTYGELIALSTETVTFTVTIREMEKRTRYSIQAVNADDAGNVHPAHKCGQTLPEHPTPKRTFRLPGQPLWSGYSTIPY